MVGTREQTTPCSSATTPNPSRCCVMTASVPSSCRDFSERSGLCECNSLSDGSRDSNLCSLPKQHHRRPVRSFARDQPFIHGMKWTHEANAESRTWILTHGDLWRPWLSRHLGRVSGDSIFSEPRAATSATTILATVAQVSTSLIAYRAFATGSRSIATASPTTKHFRPRIRHTAPGVRAFICRSCLISTRLDFRAEGAVTPSRLFPWILLLQRSLSRRIHQWPQSMGSWVGRQGSGYQLASTYWFSGRNTLQRGYRSLWVDHSFLEGGWLRDISANTNLALGSDFALQAGIQYERWQFPSAGGHRLSRTSPHQFNFRIRLAGVHADGTSRRYRVCRTRRRYDGSRSLAGITMKAGYRTLRCCGTAGERSPRYSFVPCFSARSSHSLFPKQYESATRMMPPEQQGMGAAMLAALAGKAMPGGGGALGALAGGMLGMKDTGALVRRTAAKRNDRGRARRPL